mmetsp:Transcript_31827/g.73114  ORF Transcript_31827/g.73114 Transcript_31827/m.73114 type:complete len:151 (-) Transcript_31827:71-523(-)
MLFPKTKPKISRSQSQATKKSSRFHLPTQRYNNIQTGTTNSKHPVTLHQSSTAPSFAIEKIFLLTLSSAGNYASTQRNNQGQEISCAGTTTPENKARLSAQTVFRTQAHFLASRHTSAQHPLPRGCGARLSTHHFYSAAACACGRQNNED